MQRRQTQVTLNLELQSEAQSLGGATPTNSSGLAAAGPRASHPLRKEQEQLQRLQEASSLMATGFALACAYAWEKTFDMSLDVFGSLYHLGQEGLIPKLVLSVLIPALVMPLYLNYLKPVTVTTGRSLRTMSGIDK